MKEKGAKSPEAMLEEAVERNERSIRRIRSRIERIRATLNQLEDLQSTLDDHKPRRNPTQKS